MFLSRGNRDLGVAFQAPPGSQASSGVWRVDSGLLSRSCRKRRPSSYDDGASREFSQVAVPVWGFHEVGWGAQGASRVAPGKLGFNGRGEGNASLLSSHGRVSGLKTR